MWPSAMVQHFAPIGSAIIHLFASLTWTFLVKAADSPIAALARDARRDPERMTAEPVTHDGDGACPNLSIVARGQELHHGLCDDRDRHLHTQRVIDEPVHLARVLHIGRHRAKATVFAVALLHEIHEPRPDHRTVPPASQDVADW